MQSSTTIVTFLLVSYTVISASAYSVANVSEVKGKLPKECPDLSTCCNVPSSEKRGCCPLSNATCCDDGQHCCPNGFKCDLSAGQCMKNPSQTQELVPVSLHLNPKPMKVADQIVCPNKSSCPLNYFCCNYFGGYTCCPANTVCCTFSGTPQCCPSGYICKGNQCIKACP